MQFAYDDGGRRAAGFRGQARDCVTRSIAIATGRSYREVYDALNDLARGERSPRRRGRVRPRSSAREGVYRATYERYLFALGASWVPTMRFGGGCRVHLRAGELPAGRLVVTVSRHLVAVVDGVIRDTEDPSRGGMRCVYGYYRIPEVPGG
jgi:hypothetical protein